MYDEKGHAMVRAGLRILGLLIIACILAGCTTGSDWDTLIGSPKPSKQVNPDWLDKMLVNGDIETSPVVESEETASQVKPPKLRDDLAYDRIKKPLGDLSNPAAAIAVPSTKKPSQKSPSPKGKGRDDGRVNVVINNTPSQKSDKSKTQAPAVMPLSRIEQLFDSRGLSEGKSLRQFGYDVLGGARGMRGQAPAKSVTDFINISDPIRKLLNTNNATTLINLLEHVNAGPVDPNYLIGPGDEVRLQITGGLEIDESLTVDRDGKIFLPGVGAIPLVGVKSSNLTQTIRNAIEKQFLVVEVEASLGLLHTIRVMVLGRVQKPGLQKIAANPTLVDLLTAAGGPTRSGTLRHIILRRRGQKDRSLDLYELLQSGKLNSDVILLGGDVVFIGPIGPTAAIIGPLGQGIYELKHGTVLSDLLAYAGGTNNFTLGKRFILERTIDHSRREVVGLDFTKQGNLPLRDGDIISLSEVDRDLSNTVRLSGRMLRPGTYPFGEEMKVSDLLKLAGGFLLDASLVRARLVRRLGPQRPYDIMPNDGRGVIRDEIIWVDLGAILSGDPKADFVLHRLDSLHVLARRDVQDIPTVSILGAVRNPGRYKLTGGMTLRDLVRLGGDPTGDAYAGQSVIVRRRLHADGRHFDVKLIGFTLSDLLNDKKDTKISLKNHDQIVIRQVQALQTRVTIGGRVQFPGTYVLPDGATIADLLTAAGGFLKGADVRASVFTRESVRRMQHNRLRNMSIRTKEHFARIRDEVTRDGHVTEGVANHLRLLGLDRMSMNMIKFQALGRIVVDLTASDFPETPDNLTLEPGDKLMIPRQSNVVMVMGRVFNPNAFVWREGRSVDSYLELSGGCEDDADAKRIYVIQASGEVKSMEQRKPLRLFASRYSPSPGDTILIPAKPLGRNNLKVVSDALVLLRQAAEIGMIGATAYRSFDKSSSTDFISGVDFGTYQVSVPTSVGKPYDEMLVRERELRAAE